MANTSDHHPNSDRHPDNVWQRFTHPVARDLAWVVASPPLMATRMNDFTALYFDQSTKDGCMEWLAHLERHSPSVLAIDRQSFRRLGIYFEALIAFLFSQGWNDRVMPYRLLGRNIQVAEHKVTVGELDMLLEDSQGVQIHLECAVKFYLAHQPGCSDWHNWVGPNGRDRLDIKLQRLLNHQLTLTRRPAARQLLALRGINSEKISSRYFLRGMFFAHPNSNHCLPTDANPAALTGCWQHRERFASQYGKDSHHWQALSKIDWLGGANKEQGQVGTVDTLPKMLVQHLACDTLRHLMLVEDYWPDFNSPFRKI